MAQRFINTDLLESLPRPQRKNECSITSMAGALNSIYNKQLTANDILEYTN